MARLAQCDAHVLSVLFDVVCIAWPRLVAHGTLQHLHALDVLVLFEAELVIHFSLSVGAATLAACPLK